MMGMQGGGCSMHGVGEHLSMHGCEGLTDHVTVGLLRW